MFRYWLQGGRISVGFLGGAQIDRYANLNTTVVGAYDKPKVRLPGGGGAPEIATSCGEIFITMPMSSRTFVEKLDFVTSLGPRQRSRQPRGARRQTKGPTRVATDLCVLEPDPETRELTVVSLHPGVSRADVERQCAWRLRFADELAETPAPSTEGTRRPPQPACSHRARPWGRRVSREAFICDALRTPIGRYAGALAMGAHRRPRCLSPFARCSRAITGSPRRFDEVILGCANQAGEDNRNVARMAALLAGLPDSVPGTTMNRLCASGLDAVGTAARAIRAGELDLVIAGGRRVDDAGATGDGEGGSRLPA